MESQTLQQILWWLPFGLAAILGLWGWTGTLWHGFRFCFFSYIACTIARQHLDFLIGVLCAADPAISWAKYSDFVFAGSTIVIGALLVVTYRWCWQPEPVSHNTPLRRFTSGFLSASTGWLLGAVLVWGIRSTGWFDHQIFTIQPAYEELLRQSILFLNAMIMPLLA